MVRVMRLCYRTIPTQAFSYSDFFGLPPTLLYKHLYIWRYPPAVREVANVVLYALHKERKDFHRARIAQRTLLSYQKWHPYNNNYRILSSPALCHSPMRMDRSNL